MSETETEQARPFNDFVVGLGNSVLDGFNNRAEERQRAAEAAQRNQMIAIIAAASGATVLGLAAFMRTKD